MNRRNLLAGFCGLTSGGLLMGAGAFSSVEARRRLTVEVAQDSEALLKLEQLGAGHRSTNDGTRGAVMLTFGDNQQSAGLGTDSVYEFDRDNDAVVDGLIRITNQGTQSVKIRADHTTDSELTVALYDLSDSERTALRTRPAKLAVGESIDVGVRIRTHGAALGSFEETMTIVAEASTV